MLILQLFICFFINLKELPLDLTHVLFLLVFFFFTRYDVQLQLHKLFRLHHFFDCFALRDQSVVLIC
jgi:hypothetical protein